MKKRFLFISIFILMFLAFVTSCGAASDSYGPSGSEPSGTPSTSDPGSKPSPSVPGQGNNQGYEILPGQLTACAYDDNKYFSFWQTLLTTTQDGAGLFSTYYNSYAFNTLNRIKIKLPANMDAKVHLLDGQTNVVFTSVPDINGICYLYPEKIEDSYNIMLEYYMEGQSEPTKQFEVVSQDTEFMINSFTKKQEIIQLMFVIDTTGSMGDEIKYLNAEMVDIISQVKTAYPSTQIELAILLYRDTKDQYITKYSDFSTNISSQQSFLAKQNAGGGGDFPEAVQIAMSEAASKDWNEHAKTKILVHVADAPAHDSNVQNWKNSINKLSEKGVRIITVASSGITKYTEYLFRCQSMMTNGTYVYLTDDSGIGGSHIEATVQEKPVVEYLNYCLVRLIKGYHTGILEEPIYYGLCNNQ